MEKESYQQDKVFIICSLPIINTYFLDCLKFSILLIYLLFNKLFSSSALFLLPFTARAEKMTV